MLGVAAELPVLFHALQPVGSPAAIALDVDDFELREFFKDTEPDQAGHGRHGLKRMGENMAAGMRVHAVAKRGHRGRSRVMG